MVIIDDGVKFPDIGHWRAHTVNAIAQENAQIGASHPYACDVTQLLRFETDQFGGGLGLYWRQTSGNT